MTKYIAAGAGTGGLITADGTFYICDINKKRDLVQWFATIFTYGTGGNNFGSGTVTYLVSPDGGTTKLPLKDASGTTIDSTADDNFTINMAGGSTNSDAPKLYAKMTGSTAPSVLVVVFDNNG